MMCNVAYNDEHVTRRCHLHFLCDACLETINPIKMPITEPRKKGDVLSLNLWTKKIILSIQTVSLYTAVVRSGVWMCLCPRWCRCDRSCWGLVSLPHSDPLLKARGALYARGRARWMNGEERQLHHTWTMTSSSKQSKHRVCFVSSTSPQVLGDHIKPTSFFVLL